MNTPLSQNQYHQRFYLEEILSIGIASLYNVMIIVYADFSRVADIFVYNTIIIILIIAMRYIHRFTRMSWFSFIRDWYNLLFILVIYLESNKLVHLINPNDVDTLIIQIDRFLFLGNDPTVLMEAFHLPLLTEILQIVYASFYFLPFALCVLIYFKGEKSEFHITASTIMMGFYLSFVGYYLTPAIGPRFTLDHLQNIPLTGVLLFEYTRSVLDTLEGFTRDCCPSGHTLVAVLTTLLAYRFYRPFRIVATTWTLLLIISTVYLRYHYVFDLIAGLILAVIVYRYGPTLSMRYLFGKMLSQEKLTGDDIQTLTP
jgi:membrane-associated phospholipid phosphatase